MALFDLPLPELRRYAGRNPRPQDFDAYWNRALTAVAATDPKPERVVADFSAPNAACYDLFFTGVGGARIYAKYLCPITLGPHPVVLQFHGYAMNSGDWFEKLTWVAAGHAIAAMDVRGQGGRSEDPGGVKGSTLRGHIIRGLDDPDADRLAFRQVFLDTVQLARVVAEFPEIDSERMSCWGQSQGGALALACAALEPRIERCATVFPFLCDYRRVWELDQAKDAYFELGNYFRMFDPRHQREEEVFEKLGYIDCQHLAPRIGAQVLMFTGLMDTVCPPSTQFAAYNKITAPKDVVIYPDYAHENLPGMQDQVFAFLRSQKR